MKSNVKRSLRVPGCQTPNVPRWPWSLFDSCHRAYSLTSLHKYIPVVYLVFPSAAAFAKWRFAEILNIELEWFPDEEFGLVVLSVLTTT